MKLFRRKNEVTLNRIHHTVTVNENGEKLKLVVNADPMRLVAGLNKAQKKLKESVFKENPTEEEVKEAAEYFAAVLFGREQTEKLMEFYAGDGGCVINICGQIFKDQLTAKIAAAQKKMKV
jgi:ribosomal protein L28